MHLLRKAVAYWNEDKGNWAAIPIIWWEGKVYIADAGSGLTVGHVVEAVEKLCRAAKQDMRVGKLREITFDGEVLGVTFGTVGLRLEAKDIIWLG